MRIVLVHGLGRTRLSLVGLASRLRKIGHTPEFFPYSSLLQTHERILSRLTDRLRLLAAQGKEVGLIGHSFGGLLLREAVAAVPDLRVKHFLMLGTPNRQPRLATHIYTKLPFRILRGSCGQCLADSAWFRSLPKLAIPYIVVAGTGGWRGWFDPFDGQPNDGAVAVSETLLGDNDQPFLVPALHTFIMNYRCVHRLMAERFGEAERRLAAEPLGWGRAGPQHQGTDPGTSLHGGPPAPVGHGRASGGRHRLS